MKIKNYFYSIIVLASALSPTVNASPTVGIPKKVIKLCNSGYTQDMNACAAYQYKKALDTQNVAYKKSLSMAIMVDQSNKESGLSENISSVKLLKLSQQNWNTYQKHYCQSTGNADNGGTIRAMDVLYCKASLAKMRTNMLHDQFPLGDPGA